MSSYSDSCPLFGEVPANSGFWLPQAAQKVRDFDKAGQKTRNSITDYAKRGMGGLCCASKDGAVQKGG
jgi:hypothetical protein